MNLEHTKGAEILYALARAWTPDGAWLDDDALRREVWGRFHEKNTLNVTLTRLRKRLRGAEVSGDLIERRPGQLRLRAVRAEVR